MGERLGGVGAISKDQKEAQIVADFRASIAKGECERSELKKAKESGIITRDSYEILLEELVDQLSIDSHTGFLRKDFFRPQLDKLLQEMSFPKEQRHQTTDAVMVVCFDLNRLKYINDTYGHHFGDEALTMFADRLKKLTREDLDKVYRFGGDEFFLVIHIVDDPDVDQTFFDRKFKEISDAIKADFSINADGNPVSFSTSLGYSVATKKDRKDAAVMIHEADIKMYNDKKQNGGER